MCMVCVSTNNLSPPNILYTICNKIITKMCTFDLLDNLDERQLYISCIFAVYLCVFRAIRINVQPPNLPWVYNKYFYKNIFDSGPGY